MHRILDKHLEEKLSNLEQQIEKQVNLFYHKRIIKYMSSILAFLLISTIGLMIMIKYDYTKDKAKLYNQIVELQNSLLIVSKTSNKEPDRLIFISFADSLINSYRNNGLTTAERVIVTNLIWTNSREFNISPYLLLTLIEKESAFTKKAKSNKNAYGLCQFIPSTFLTCSRLLHENKTIKDIFELESQIRYAAFYVRLLYDLNENMHVALTVYNMGSCTSANSYSYEIINKSKNYEKRNGFIC